MAAALQVWSPTFSRAFDALPPSVRTIVQGKVDEMGARLETFPHQRPQGRSEFKLRVGDFRVLYEFDAQLGRVYLHYVGIVAKSTSEADLVANHPSQGAPMGHGVGAAGI